MSSAQGFINVAAGQVGTQEQPPNSNDVPYWPQIGLPGDQGQPWCAAFVTWCARAVGIGDQVNFIYCPTGVDQFKARGAFVASAQPGDVVFFNWGYDHVADHTGIVVHPNLDGTILTIEGNSHLPGQTNDMVEYHTRPTSVVVGFGRPAWDKIAGPIPPPAPVPSVGNNPGTGYFPRSHPQLAQGTTGPWVAHLQAMVGAGADGVFGPATAAAVRAKQAQLGLAADGVCGPFTWSALHPVLRQGMHGGLYGIAMFVAEVQQEVGVPADGDFGPVTDAAVRDFQRTRGLGVDGVVGPQTYRAFFG